MLCPGYGADQELERCSAYREILNLLWQRMPLT